MRTILEYIKKTKSSNYHDTSIPMDMNGGQIKIKDINWYNTNKNKFGDVKGHKTPDADGKIGQWNFIHRMIRLCGKWYDITKCEKSRDKYMPYYVIMDEEGEDWKIESWMIDDYVRNK